MCDLAKFLMIHPLTTDHEDSSRRINSLTEHLAAIFEGARAGGLCCWKRSDQYFARRSIGETTRRQTEPDQEVPQRQRRVVRNAEVRCPLTDGSTAASLPSPTVQSWLNGGRGKDNGRPPPCPDGRCRDSLA